MKDNTFSITFKNWFQGYSPTAFKNALTEIGGNGHAASMQNVDVINGDYITQGPGLAALTAGTQDGAVTELINYIMDKPVTSNATYGIGATKLQQISATAVTNTGIWPHTITDCTDGESVILLKGVLYYLYNKSSGGDIGTWDLSTTFDDNWGSTVPTGKAALQKAPHPVAKKEDIMLFGNGRYVGTYINETTTLAPTKLDFGNEAEVADVLYHQGFWHIAVNTGKAGDNRTEGQIYLYDGSATSSLLADETGVGMQRIGFMYKINGIIYVAYQDLSASGFIIGYIQGSQIKELRRYTGTLPTFAQKTLYKNTILTISSGLVYSAGSLVGGLPYQLSQLADGGYTNVGAIAAPFGTPMVASYLSTDFQLAKFSGYATACNWRSIVIPLSAGGMKGYIDNVTVLTKSLGANARCDLIIEANQATTNSNTMQITGTGITRHSFSGIGLGQIEDFRVFLNWANGNATNDCAIRKIFIDYHFVEQ